MTDALPLDELLPRLRARAADPERRTSSRPSELTAGVRTMDLGGLLSMGRSLAEQLRGVVAANQQGMVDPAGTAAALGLERAMTTPVPSVLPGPADEAWLTEWAGSHTQAELLETQMRVMREQGARRHIETIAAMSPEQRTTMGLGPGWEREMADAMGIAWPPSDGGS